MATSTHETRFILTAKDKTKAAFKSAQLSMKDVGSAVTGVHTKLLALAGIGGIGALLPGIISTNAEMQRLKSSLKTVTGSSEAAGDAFERIQKFAKTTPFDLNQWTEAFIKMKSLGLDPSEAALTSYGNTAAAMGKSLSQMIEAVADASTGEFERLKEFGIRASKEGENIKFTFQGVTTEVGNSAAEITKYLQGIGNNQFAGAMDDQMQNLDAAFSNLRGSIAQLAVKLGESGLNDFVRDLANNVTEFAESFDARDFQEFMITVGGGLFALKETLMAVRDGWAGIVSTVGTAFMPDSGVGRGALPGYKLGDFNNTNGNMDYFELIKRLESQRDERMAEKQDQTNSQLREMTDILRDQNNLAVAG